ncbi:hypothetical protein VUR80DRAFT_614 [Thermomyces stellatus]
MPTALVPPGQITEGMTKTTWPPLPEEVLPNPVRRAPSSARAALCRESTAQPPARLLNAAHHYSAPPRHPSALPRSRHPVPEPIRAGVDLHAER